MKQRYFKNTRASVLVFAAVMLAFAFASMTKICFSSAMVFIVDEGTLTKSQTGDIVSLFYLTYAPLQVVGGFVVDKWKPERFMILGLVGAAVANLLIYFYQGYAFMMTVWALNGT